ncbi:hypothetical protein ACEQ8H_006791 [Pleosporales sp. CAS-2024a]
MSDANDTAGLAVANSANPAFTERELQMLGWAMQSLKTGPPEARDRMSNPRSAANAWAKIKGKLITNPGGNPSSPAKKAPAGRKKAAPAATGEDGEIKKTPRKRAPKKQDVDGENASPKKKGRATKSEEVAKDESDASTEIKLKTEPEDAEDAEENVADEMEQEV